VLKTILKERIRPRTVLVAIPIQAEPEGISIETGVHEVAALVSDTYSLTARNVATHAETLLD